MLGSPVQIAYGTDDVHTAARRWTDRGIGPFFVLEHIALAHAEIDGVAAEFDHSSAYGQWGDVMVELICQHEGGTAPIVGASGVHHVATFVDDFEESSAALTAAGLDRTLFAQTANGMPFAFHDARATTGHFIEIYERTDRLADFYAMVRSASIDWTGADPVRIL